MRGMLMGIIKVKGTYYARKYIPAELQAAVARVLERPKARVSWLKRSLHTKDQREANIKAKPVLIEFDRILAKAAAIAKGAPFVRELSEIEIARMAAYQHASMLEEDEEVRRDGTGSEDLFQAITQQLRDTGTAFSTPFATAGKPSYGLSDREMYKLRENAELPFAAAKAALAKGDSSFVQEQLDELLDAFHINLDPRSTAYRQLGMEVLKSFVRALEAIQQRNLGAVIDTPRIIEPKAPNRPLEATFQPLWTAGRKRNSPPPRQHVSSSTPHAASWSFTATSAQQTLPAVTCASSAKRFKPYPCGLEGSVPSQDGLLSPAHSPALRGFRALSCFCAASKTRGFTMPGTSATTCSASLLRRRNEPPAG